MKLSEVVADQVSVTFEPYPDAGETVTVVFRPKVLTPAKLSTMSMLVAGISEDDNPFYEFLGELIVSWDVFNDDTGQPIDPSNSEEMRLVPTPFLVRMAQEVQKATMPGEARRGASNSSSKQAAR